LSLIKAVDIEQARRAVIGVGAGRGFVISGPKHQRQEGAAIGAVGVGTTGSRPKAAHRIQELARKHAPEAIKTLADIAKKGTPGARVSAAIALAKVRAVE
jgi:hypothetical protein